MLSSEEFLLELSRRGARRIRRVSFRANRSTVWSLTQRGTVLNLHEAYRAAPPVLLDAFATLAKEGGVSSRRSRRAAEEIHRWPDLAVAIEAARAAHDSRRTGLGIEQTHCCATPEQRAYLHTLYRYFNLTRFGGILPPKVPVRLSSRMRSSLGHMLPGERPDGTRYVSEIALNVDLMLAANGAERVDTLLHEMAHVADYLGTGNRSHGPSWRAWAARVGCRPTTLYDRPVASRRRRRDRVTRVPPLPSALRRLIGAEERPARPSQAVGHSQPKTPAVTSA